MSAGRSGQARRTPVNIFAHGRGYVIALTYGRDSEWVKNVQAAGECVVETRGRHIRLVRPQVVRDPSRRMMPWPVRLILRPDRRDRLPRAAARGGRASLATTGAARLAPRRPAGVSTPLISATITDAPPPRRG